MVRMDGVRARNRGRLQAKVEPSISGSPHWRRPGFPGFAVINGLILIAVVIALIATVFASLRFVLSYSSRNYHESSHADPEDPEDPDVAKTRIFDAFITIYAFDRPRQLLNLLQDIANEARVAKFTVGVNVIDDNSYGCVFHPVHENIFDVHGTGSLDLHLIKVNPREDFPNCSARSRFRKVEAFLTLQGWNMYVSRYRHSRRRHWHLVRMSYALLHPIAAKYFLFLPDDNRLAKSFFPKVVNLWNTIDDKRKLTLMLHVEESRERVPVWTDLKPRHIGGGISRIGWVESGNFLCTGDFLQFMNWSFPRVSIKRWIDNPPISSGVGSTLSERIHAAGLRMYRLDESYVAHVGISLSKMNAEFRAKSTPSLVTKYFADGSDAYHSFLSEASTVTASIASQWMRESALHSAVESLSAQVDHVNVYLNGYDAIPAYLYAPYITVLRSSDTNSKGDIGDIGKFFWCNNIATDYHLTADDDIVYPEDYVESLLAFHHQYKPPVVVGVHGIRLKQEELKPSDGKRGKGYYGSREVWMATESVPEAVSVHILGTGTMMYRPVDLGRIELDTVFPVPNMADIWFGILAQKRNLPLVVIPHKEGWLKEIPGTFEDSIYKKSTRSRSADRLQTEAAKSIESWLLHEPSRNNTVVQKR